MAWRYSYRSSKCSAGWLPDFHSDDFQRLHIAHFRYQALNATGQPVAGELHAESVALALAQLEADGLTVQSIGYAAAESRFAEPPQANAGGRNPFGGGGERG